ncbi:697_t:CDS:2, partial [Scutellospora calospora]
SSYNAVTTSSQSSVRKVLRSSSYGPLDHYIVRLLSYSDNEKFKILLLRLTIAVSEHDIAMYEALHEDLIGETLTFDGSERESYVSVMEKTNTMIEELKGMNIKVSAVITDSASLYAAA